MKPDRITLPAPEELNVWRRRFWVPALKSAELGHLRPQDLRHTAVALWIAAGARPKEVAVRAGHTSVSFTLDRYGHLFPGSEEVLNDSLDALARDAREDSSDPARARSRAMNADSIARVARATEAGSEDGVGAQDADQGTWWALRDSNPRPQPCEGCALTN